MIWDSDAEVFKGVIYEVEQPADAKSDTVEYCFFADVSPQDFDLTGRKIREYETDTYLLVKYVTKEGKCGKYAIKKHSIKIDKEHFRPAQGRSLVKAMLRGL